MHRAIETRYAGYRFRSRLEARYAVLFDSLKIKWDYEPEGFELGDGRYLPDFWLPMPLNAERGYWVEIKALPPTLAERRLMAQLCAATRHHGWFFWGPPSEASLALPQVAGKPVSLNSGKQAVLLGEAEPIYSCAIACHSSDFESACIAATSARFEFKDGQHRVARRITPSAGAFDEVAE